MNELPNGQSAAQAAANLDALFQTGTPTGAAEKTWELSSHISAPTLLPPQNRDRLTELPEKLLTDFPAEKHPFRPYTPQELDALKEDIGQNGILQPLIVRPHPSTPGHYEIIAGHNRRTAAREIGYFSLPCIVRELDDDTALFQMISTNLKQRTKLLPSEKAWAYRYQLEAMKRQGQRTDLTSTQVVSRLRSNEELGQMTNESRETVRRYIRLTYLTPPLLKKVDEGRLPLTVGESLSHLSTPGQQIVENFFFLQHSITISQNIADQLREMEEGGKLNEPELEAAFLTPVVVQQMNSVKIKMKKWRKYFHANATQQEVIETIEKALTAYFEANK